MKAHALVPALALAAALLAPPLADASSRHRSDRGRRPPAHGYYGHRPSYGYHGYGYRTPRPYDRSYRYYTAPYGYYGYGYPGYGYGAYGYGHGNANGYGGYGYGYYPPPPPRYCPPRPRVGFWFGF
jgi:hypothetical protein